MVVKMEGGWDRVKAAAFSYSATAVPRLTGALITVAAFMPIGFAKSTTGEYAGGIFWIVGAAVLLSWLVSGLFTPYLAVKMLPKDFGKHHAGGDPYDTPFYRKLRGWIDLAIERRWWVIGATAAALVLAVAGMKFVPQQFFPNSTRPELIVELRVKEGASFAATTEQVKRMETVLAKDEDVRFFTAYTGAGAPRFYLSLNPELPNPGYAQFIVMTRDLEARERVRSRLMATVDETFPRYVGAGHASGAGSAGRLPGAVPHRRARHSGRALDRARRRARRGRESPGARRPARLERSGPYAARRSRPGQGACARSDACGRGDRDADLDEWRDAVATARGRGPDRHRRASGSVRAARPRYAQGHQSVHAPGHGGAAIAGRARQVRARRAGPVAPQSRHGDHCSRRRQGRRTGRVGDAGHSARAERHRGEAPVRLSHRRGRRRRGKRQGQRSAGRGRAGDAGDDPADPDAAAAELLADVAWCS